MRLALLLLLASASASAQPLTVFPEPSGDANRVCASHETTHVCRVGHNGETEIVVSRGGRDVARWNTAAGVQAGPFAVFASDLDRDGGQDLIVAALTAVSNGLGVEYWTVGVLPDGARAPAYSFQVEDFSPAGQSFGHDGDRLVLWATDWLESDDPSGRRPSGMYFTGRPFTLSSRGLFPVASLPVRARRLLNSFDRSAAGGPVGHLSDRRAESRRTDPAFTGCRQHNETLTVQSVREASNEQGARYLVLDVGRGRGISYMRDGYAPNEEGLTHLGDRDTGRLFPAEYLPPGLKDTLPGHELRLTTCVADGDWDRARVLWL